MKKLLLLLLFGTISIGFSQDNKLNISSPQVTDFSKFGNIQSSKYTGSLDLSIPICSVSEGEFSESVSIRYNSSGFMPAKRGSTVGLDWHLNTGGAIIRSVRGRPDEHKGKPLAFAGSIGPLNGFYYGVTRHPASEDNVFSFSPSVGRASSEYTWVRQPPNTNWQERFESQPDIFNFNFHGITGSFFFNNQGGVEITPNQQVHIEVDLSNFSIQDDPFKSIPKHSEIIFKLDNGYTYYFGGGVDNVEFTIPVNSPTGPNSEYTVASAVINTWYLTKVVAPSGKQMIYKYEGSIEDIFTQFNYDAYPEFENALSNGEFRPIVLNKYVNETRGGTQVHSTFLGNTFVAFSASIAEHPIQISYEVLKQSYLKSIYTEDFKISFDYKVKENLFLNDPNTPENFPNSLYNFKDKRLTKIQLRTKTGEYWGSNEQLIKTVNFAHNYYGNRMFLSRVIEEGKHPYKFEYYKTNDLPRPDTHGIDHWGFWNGGNSIQTELIPHFYSNKETGDRVYDHPDNVDYRAPSGSCDVALLSKITYPTLGYSEFEYEPHDYAKRLDRVSANDFLVGLETIGSNKRAGGARIKRIRDHDGNTYTNSRTFYYTRNYSTNGSDEASAGILLDWPRYSYYIRTNVSSSNVVTLIRSKSSSFNRNSYDGFHMSYSQVTEVNEDDSYTTAFFNNYESHPDINDFNDLDADPLISGISLGAVIPENLYKNYVGQHLNDLSVERGKLSKEQNFTNSGKLIQEKEFQYNTDPQRFDDYVSQIHSSGGLHSQASKRYSYPNFLTKEITRVFDTGNTDGQIQQVKNINYDHKFNKLRSQETISSAGELLRTEYKYPFDLICNSENSAGNGYKYKVMADKNLINFPVEVINEIGNKVSSAIVNNYDLDGNKVLLKESKNYSTSNVDSTYSPLHISPDCELIYDDNLETRVSYDRYDALGNLEQYHQEDGLPVAIIWGYNKTKIIAKITNAPYDILQNIVIQHPETSTNVNAISALVSISDSDFEAYSNNSWQDKDELLIQVGQAIRRAIPNVMVETYTYDPLIGVTSMTNARDETVFYNYDAINRLSYITDHDKHVIRKINYNYDGLGFSMRIHGSNAGIPGMSLAFNVQSNGSVHGSGNFEYSWSVNGVAQSSSGATLNSTFNAVGTQQISCHVTDLVTGDTTTASKTIVIFNPLNNPTLNSNKTYAVEGNSIVFTPSLIYGGSRNYRYEWYINDVLQDNENGNEFNHIFGTDGVYTIKIRVIDERIASHFTEATKTVYIYDSLIPGNIISANPITANTDNTFDVNPTKGSGYYSYDWTIQSNYATYNSSSKSFVLNLNLDYYGAVVATCKITDTRTGEIKTVSRTVNVNGAPPLNVAISRSNINVNRYRLTAVVSNGSGNYSYKWFRVSTLIATSSNISISLDCFNRTEKIKLEVTDLRTGLTKIVKRTYRFSGTCGDTGGGDGNPRNHQ